MKTYGGFELCADGHCALCGGDTLVLISSKKVTFTGPAGICEPCARIADWQFRSLDDAELAGSLFPTVAGAALVLIVRERILDGHPDTLAPFDVLMVERKDEPGAFGLPGGKMEPGEDAPAAAVRGLYEETTLVTWAPALEAIYQGFSARGRMVSAFLCRAYAGKATTVEGEGSCEWLPWPPSQHAGVLRGYYTGLELAFDFRHKAHSLYGTESALSQDVGRYGRMFIESSISPERDSEEAVQNRQAASSVMTAEQIDVARRVVRDLLAPPAPDAPLASSDEGEVEEPPPDEPVDAEFADTEGREGPPRPGIRTRRDTE